MKYDKFDRCVYSRKFESCSARVKEMLNALASSLYRTNVSWYGIHKLENGLWDVEIEFYNLKGSKIFQQYYELCMKASAEKLRKENKMKDKKVETTISKIQNAYKEATCDETRETLKRVWPDAFKDKHKLINITNDIQWHADCIGAGEYSADDNEIKQDILYFQLIGVDSDNSCPVLTMDHTGITNHRPGDYLLITRNDLIEELGNDSGFAIFRKEKI